MFENNFKKMIIYLGKTFMILICDIIVHFLCKKSFLKIYISNQKRYSLLHFEFDKPYNLIWNALVASRNLHCIGKFQKFNGFWWVWNSKDISFLDVWFSY